MSQTLEARSLNSTMLTCRDMKTAIPFYRDVLGFRIDEAWPDKDNPQWASLTLNGQVVMLGGAMTEEALDSPQCAQASKEEREFWAQCIKELKENKVGVGIMTYYMVDDVDAYYRSVVSRGAKPSTNPKSQFYGIRDFMIEDPTGYRLIFYTPITMSECQSCGMPMKDAKPGAMYCQYCTDDSGQLRPYEQVLEGTKRGYFMQMLGQPEATAATSAREHLSKMPAWKSRGM